MNLLLGPLLKWALGGTLFLSLLLGGALWMERRHSAKLQLQIERCSEARRADRTEYEKQSALSAQRNLEHVRKVEQEQRTRTDAIQSRWDADRARLAELMRNKGTAPDKGAAGGSGSPAVPPAAGGPDGEAAVCVPASGALSAAETELKLRLLQDWITEQLQVAR